MRKNKRIFSAVLSTLASATVAVPLLSTVSCTPKEIATHWNDKVAPQLLMANLEYPNLGVPVDIPKAIISTKINKNIEKYDLAFLGKDGEPSSNIDASKSYMKANKDGKSINLHIAPSTYCEPNRAVTILITKHDSAEEVLMKNVMILEADSLNLLNPDADPTITLNQDGSFTSSNDLCLTPAINVPGTVVIYYSAFYDKDFNMIYEASSAISVVDARLVQDETYWAFGIQSGPNEAFASISEPTPIYIMIQIPKPTWTPHFDFAPFLTFNPTV